MIQQNSVVDISKIKLINGYIGNRNSKKFKDIEKEGEKRCTICIKLKSINDFSVSSYSIDGKCSSCKECQNKRSKNIYAKNVGKTVEQIESRTKNKAKIINGKKMCSRCNEWKLVGDFGVNNNAKYNIHHSCKSCANKDGRIYTFKEARRVKLICMMGYGGKCVCCGESQIELLTIEHIRNKGHELIYGHTIQLMRKLIELNFPKGHTVLCWNCNCSTRHGVPCVHTKEYAKYWSGNLKSYKYSKQKELDELEHKWAVMNGIE